jgi:hypothetical protein
LDKTFKKADIPTINYDITQPEDGMINVEFNDINDVEITIKSFNINVQIAPGWIE